MNSVKKLFFEYTMRTVQSGTKTRNIKKTTLLKLHTFFPFRDNICKRYLKGKFALVDPKTIEALDKI